MFHGPATVIGCDGSVAFIRHQGSVYRLPTCRLRLVGNEYHVKSRVSADAESEEASESSDKIDSPEGAVDTTSKTVEFIESQADFTEEEDVDSGRAIIEDASETSGGGASDGVVQPQATKNVPNSNDNIRYKKSESSEWESAVVINRAGKQTSKSGKNKYCVNVKPADNSPATCIDLQKTHSWEYLPVEKVNVVTIPNEQHDGPECVNAKQKELAASREFDVYEEVPDEGQFRISTTWVMTKKMMNGEYGVKARLVARGFEETQHIISDSPTCTQDAFRLFLCIAAKMNWLLECTDIKSAFLQGKELTREVFVQPPKEAQVRNKLWRLKKGMYGLQDASRMWFLNVSEVLQRLGCKQVGLDQSVYVHQENLQLTGMFVVHVDDFLHIGRKYFYSHVVEKLREAFKVGSMGKQAFAYIGMEIEQTDNVIKVSQKSYISEIKIEGLSAERKTNKDSPLNKTEHAEFRKIVGQLNWVARHTRPDIMFDVMELSTRLNKPTVGDYKRLVKTIKKIAIFRCLDRLSKSWGQQ